MTNRVIDAFPGCLTWLTLLGCMIGALVAPKFTLLLGGIGAFYVALRFVVAGAANLLGLRRIRRWQSTDWQAYYADHHTQQALSWDDVQHVVLIPNYNEPLELLRITLDSLRRFEQASTRMTVVLAMEAGESGAILKAERLQSEFEDYFARFHFTVHPRGLPGEMQCKSANLAWAARWIKRKLVDQIGLVEETIVVTTMDADTRWHPDYFMALTTQFALSDARHSLFWQAPLRYQDNIERIHPVMRLVNDYGSGIELAYLAAPWWRGLPISSYSLSLRLINRAGYWDTNVIADEWHMFIKAFFASEMRVRLEPIFLPFCVRVTIGDSLWETVRNRYMQTLRHAWGSKEITYVIRQMLSNRDLPFAPGLRLLLRVAHDVTMASFGWMLVSAGGVLPVLFHADLLQQFWADPLSVPGLLVIVLSFAVILVLGAIYGVLEGKMRIAEAGVWKHEEHATRLSFVLLPVLIFVFVTLPVLHAQTLLMLGRSLKFHVTRKQ